MNDIDLDPNLPGNRVFTQALIPEFHGEFNGNGFCIRGLNILGGGNLGFFGELAEKALVTNLGLANVAIEGTGNQVGGLVAVHYGSASNCYTTGLIRGIEHVGGLIATNDAGSISDCYSTCAALGEANVGGLIGNNDGSVSTSYSTGPVSGREHIGGMVGGTGRGDVSGSFWDIETSGLASSSEGTGLTTAEMQTASIFLDAGWDFVDETANGTDDIWWILEGQDYPRLWWEVIEYVTAFILPTAAKVERTG